MNFFKKLLLFVIIFFLSLALTIHFIGRKTEQELNNFSMLPDGVKVVDKVILGRRERTFSKGWNYAHALEFNNGISRAFRRGAISLVCTNRGTILLVEQDFRMPRRYVGPGSSGKGFFTALSPNGSKGGMIEIKNVKMLTREYFDTIVSDPLSPSEIVAIQEVLESEDISRTSLTSFDGSNAFISEYQISDVNQLINNCQSKDLN